MAVIGDKFAVCVEVDQVVLVDATGRLGPHGVFDCRRDRFAMWPRCNRIDSLVRQVSRVRVTAFARKRNRFAIWPKVRTFMEAVPPGGVVADVGEHRLS
jgi:hypothetical protein